MQREYLIKSNTIHEKKTLSKMRKRGISHVINKEYL